jgi:hypothetical protein
MSDNRIQELRDTIKKLQDCFSFRGAQKLQSLLEGLTTDRVPIPRDIITDALNVCRTHTACADNRSVESLNLAHNLVYALERM